MDPLSITASCVSLVATITKTSITVTKFVRDVRNSRSDLDAVSRELISLQTVLGLLIHDASGSDGAFPETLKRQINGIVNNCTDVVIEIEQCLEKHNASGKLGRGARWATVGHDDMSKLRSSLEAHKCALDIALDMVAM